MKRFIGLTRTIYFRAFVSLLVIGLILTWLPLPEIWDAARRVSLQAWILFVLAFVLIHVVGVFKWRFIVGMGKLKLPFSFAFRCYFYGLFGNLFLPSVIGGDVVRAGMAAGHVEEKEQIIIGSLIDRFLDVCAMLILILFGAVFAAEALSDQHRKILAIISAFLAIFITTFVALIFVRIPLKIPEKLQKVVIRARLVLIHLFKNPAYAAGTLCLSVLIQGSFVLLNAFLGSLCGIEVGILTWFVVWPLAKITAMVPVSLGGIGVREVALAAFFAPFGVLYSNAVGYGFVWEAVVIAGSLLGFALTLIPWNNLFSIKKAVTN